MILLDAGRVIMGPVTGEIAFEGGPHPDYQGDYDKLCQYLTS